MILKKKYGKAYWDISFVLKDFNGLRTAVTPVINAADTVTALIFSSERNGSYTYFRVIDKQTRQTRLKERGDKNATLFTQYTLKGLFSTTQNNYNYAKNAIKNIYSSKQYSTNSIGTDVWIVALTTCWTYVTTSPPDAAGDYKAVATQQCSTSLMVVGGGTAISSSTGLGSTTPAYSGGGGNSNTLQVFDNRIVDDLHPCLHAVLDQIKSLSQGKIASIIKQFSGEVPNWDWNLSENLPSQYGSFSSNNPGITVGTNTYLNYGFLQNVSDLAVAKTIIHESVHAYLNNYFITNYNSAKKTYPQLLNDFISGKTANDAEHNQMITSFISDIATALQQYGILKGYKFDSIFYNDLAWSGLDYQSNAALSQDDKLRISNVQEAEYSLNGHMPKGAKACH